MHQPLDSHHTTDAFHAAEEAAQTLHAAFEEAGATVEIDALPEVCAESAPLIQVFQNLLANAVKYRNPKTPSRIHVSAVASHGEVRFSVKDNGIGIERGITTASSKCFGRLHGEEQEGLGIGLRDLQEGSSSAMAAASGWIRNQAWGRRSISLCPRPLLSSEAKIARATA